MQKKQFAPRQTKCCLICGAVEHLYREKEIVLCGRCLAAFALAMGDKLCPAEAPSRYRAEYVSEGASGAVPGGQNRG